MECSAAGLLVVNLNDQCVFANQAFCDLIGYTVAEVQARSMLDITHPDDVALSLQGMRRLTGGEATGYQIEKRYVHKSGRPVWVLLTVTLLPRADHLPSDMSVGVAQDISRRKAVEEALQESESLFRTIAENAGDLILIVDYPGSTQFMSARRTEALGYSVHELEDHNALGMVHPEDLALIHRNIDAMARKGANAVIAELRYRHKNGEWHYVEAHACAVRNRGGELERIVIISRMIDDRVLARQQAQDREERLQLLLDSAAEAIYGLDLKGNCTFCNRALLRMLDYPDASCLLGKNMHEVIHHSRADDPHTQWKNVIFQAFRTSSVMHVDDEVVWRSDGSSFRSNTGRVRCNTTGKSLAPS